MSLYNQLFGVNDHADLLLAVLGLRRVDVPRFRDCYLAGKNIVIYTRTGGGNRDYYDSEEMCRSNFPEYFDGKTDPTGPWNSDLQANPYYSHDEDEEYDSTYASFYFRFPEEYDAQLTELAELDNSTPPAEKWQSLFDALREVR